MSSEPESDERDECQVLRQLRATPGIFDQIAAATGSELGVQTALRRQFPDDLVRAAMTLHELRRKGSIKFRHADRMWFDRQGLEQSTSESVAQYKAQRFDGQVFDLCSGIGSDALALALRCQVTAVDINPASCLRTEWNAEVCGVGSRIQTRCVDVHKLTDCDIKSSLGLVRKVRKTAPVLPKQQG